MTAISGLEVALGHPPDVLRGRRIGLVTNPAAVDRRLRLAIDRLWEAGASPEPPRGGPSPSHGASPGPAGEHAAGAWRVTRLFGPEHGVRGDYVAGGTVPDSVDELTGLPVSSLYGPHK
ncbi:MAG: DUF1343 domain-containing protein, partial [Chloroflexota bacterium]|nr:DUF1343 domain-containing protein [Chloroflexota bacterium]